MKRRPVSRRLHGAAFLKTIIFIFYESGEPINSLREHNAVRVAINNDDTFRIVQYKLSALSMGVCMCFLVLGVLCRQKSCHGRRYPVRRILPSVKSIISYM